MTYLRRSRSRRPAISREEASQGYRLSTGETLDEASQGQTVALVFLRHFGCTFTRRILRGLEQLKEEAGRRNTRLVLVHMLAEGEEGVYLDRRESAVARIADPMCELYEAFGLGKGSLIELFGPRVWLPMFLSLVRGCGIGQTAGDGAQMPGAFLLRDGQILASQVPRSQAFLPDLEALFIGVAEEPELALRATA